MDQPGGAAALTCRPVAALIWRAPPPQSAPPGKCSPSCQSNAIHREAGSTCGSFSWRFGGPTRSSSWRYRHPDPRAARDPSHADRRLPDINIPVVSIIWNYTGLDPDGDGEPHRRRYRAVADHHRRRHRAHRVAVAERRRGGQGLLPARRASNGRSRRSPPSRRRSCGSCRPEQPAAGHQLHASSVPILQLALQASGCPSSSSSTSALNFIRTRLVTVPGAAIPYPYGGKQRQVQVDLDTAALQARGCRRSTSSTPSAPRT